MTIHDRGSRLKRTFLERERAQERVQATSPVFPTDHFTIREPQNPSIDVPELHKMYVILGDIWSSFAGVGLNCPVT